MKTKRAPRKQTRIPIVVLGEKDHGKSTTIGRLLYETNSIGAERIRDARVASKNLRKKFEWAHLLDSFRYEREREMTLDTTRAIVKSGALLYELIDVPGHKELVKNMVSGASNAECAVIIVAADEGIRPQTILHMRIAKLLGIRRVIVAINKCDAIGYSALRFYAIARNVKKHLAKIGFVQPLIIPLVADSGENMVRKSRTLSWFKGPTLLVAMRTKFHRSKYSARGRLLIPVQDVYGYVIVGRVERGRVSIGDRVYLFPAAAQYCVQELSSGRKAVQHASARDSVEIVLAPTPLRVQRGDALVAKNPRLESEFRCRCFLFAVPGRRLFLESGFKSTQVRMYPKDVAISAPVSTLLILQVPTYVPARFILRGGQGNIVGFGISA